MPEFHALEPCPSIPDNLSIPQFILDSSHPLRPLRPSNVPWLVEDASGRPVGLEEIRTRTTGLANALKHRWGIREDDVVAIFSPNHIDYPITLWAIHRLGAIASCANPTYTSDELAYQLKITKSTIIIAHPAFVETALAAARECGIPKDHLILIDRSEIKGPYPTVPDLVEEGLARPISFTERTLSSGEAKTKLAFLSCSSGTTGKPKAVAIPHYAVVANVIQMAAHNKVNIPYTTWNKQRFRPGDVAAAVLPFFHIYGLVVNLHFMLFSGLSLVVVPKFDFVKFLKSIDRHRITHLLVVPPQVVLLCKHHATKDYDLSHVRFVNSGAAPLSAELTQQLMKIMPNASIGQGYGMTETSTTVSMFPLSQFIGTPGSAGQLLPGCIARIVKEDGTLADYDEEGELHITGPSMALRYLDNDEATRETFIDGWVRTGDEVKMARNGDLFVVDRLKEIMKVRGFQVAPAELEGHLLDHPDVADVCVVGIHDDYSGEIPLAFIILEEAAARKAKTSPFDAEEIKKSLMKHVSDAKVAYKWLKGGVEFVDSIPKNPSGKLLRRFMRDKAKEVVARRAAVKAKL